jgi:short-subunit dehydrogenase
MPRPLQEQIVVITGASSGIGRETALEFARNGSAVILASRNDAALKEVAEQVHQAGSRAHTVVTDVSDWSQVAHLAQEAVHRFGRIDTWVNNAGISEYATIEQMEIDEIRRIIDVDLLGPIYGCKAVIPYMKRSGGGTIINIGSGLSERSVPLQGIYVTAKHGLKGFTEALRLELQHDRSNINLTLILPSSINTPFFDHARSRTGQQPAPIPPIYDPRTVARAIVFAAKHPRREIFVGASGKLISMLENISPGLLDRYMVRGGRAFKQQLTGTTNGRHDNLFNPTGPNDSRGRFGSKAHSTSFYTRVFEFHPLLKRALLAVAAAGTVSLIRQLTQPRQARFSRPITAQRIRQLATYE